MKPGEYDKKIDELISRAIGRQRPPFDFDKWQAEHEKEIQTYKEQAKKSSDPVPSSRIWKTIIESRITKLAAAAVIIIAVLIGIRTFTGATAWAKIVRAFNEVENVHIVGWVTDPNGKKTAREEYWVKRPNFTRNEYPDISIIDNGKERLTIDKKQQTAQFEDSTQDYYPQADAIFAYASLIRGQDYGLDAGMKSKIEKPVLKKLPSECTDEMFVYEGHFPAREGVRYEAESFKIWVVSTTMLVQRYVAVHSDEDNAGVIIESVFDYEQIPDEMFLLNVPEGYQILPRKPRAVFSGAVLDQSVEPVSGAGIYITDGFANLHGATNENGKFEIKSGPQRRKLQFPIFVRAFRLDWPDKVAWTVLTNPQDKKELEGVFPTCPDLRLSIDEETEGIWKCTGAEGIVVRMEPALQIAGIVTDEAHQPIAGARVYADRILLRYADGMPIMTGPVGMGGPDNQHNPKAVTDSHGRYLLSNLPPFWKGFPLNLQIKAAGYAPCDKQIKVDQSLLMEDINFRLLRADVTVRGKVTNNSGDPLAGYYVGYSISNGYTTPTKTDRRGRFELQNCPSSSNLNIRINGSLKPGDWDRDETSKGKEFIYYLDKIHPLQYTEDKKEYYVEFVLDIPDRLIEFEVKNTDGQPVKGLEVRLKHVDMGAQWISLFAAETDEMGKCVLRNFPRIREPLLSVQWHFIGRAQSEQEEQQRQELRKYKAVIRTIELPGDAKKYKIEVTVPRLGETKQGSVTVHKAED
jgi:outer membrane lipoprotein-sorting protein